MSPRILIGTTDGNDAAGGGERGEPFAAYAARAQLRASLHVDGDDWVVFNGVKAATSHVEAVPCFGAVVGDDTAVLNGVKAVAAHVDAVLFVNAPVGDDVSVVNGVTAVAAHVKVFLSGPAVGDDGAVSKCGLAIAARVDPDVRDSLLERGGGPRREGRRGARVAGGVWCRGRRGRSARRRRPPGGRRQ